MKIHYRNNPLRDIRFPFYGWNQFKVIPLASTLRTSGLTSPKVYCVVERDFTACHVITMTPLRHQNSSHIYTYGIKLRQTTVSPDSQQFGLARSRANIQCVKFFRPAPNNNKQTFQTCQITEVCCEGARINVTNRH